jgi:hypothetical protein
VVSSLFFPIATLFLGVAVTFIAWQPNGRESQVDPHYEDAKRLRKS